MESEGREITFAKHSNEPQNNNAPCNVCFTVFTQTDPYLCKQGRERPIHQWLEKQGLTVKRISEYGKILATSCGTLLHLSVTSQMPSDEETTSLR